MSDVIDVFDRILQAPAPPMPSRETVLSHAHRARQRQRWTRSGFAATALALIVVAVLVVPSALPGKRSAPVPGASGSPTPLFTSTPSPSVTAVPWHDPGDFLIIAGPVKDRANALLATLLANVPPGYTRPTDDNPITVIERGEKRQAPPKSSSVYRRNNGDVEYFAGTMVHRGGRTGFIVVAAGPRNREGFPDECTTVRGHPGMEDGCRMVTTSTGIRVRVSWNLSIAEYSAAINYPDVTVVLSEGLGRFDDPLPLTSQIFTVEELAELAANPAFRP